MSRISAAISRTLRSVVPAFEGAIAGALDHRAVGDGIGERHAQFDQIGAAALQRCDERGRAVAAMGSPAVM